MPLRASGGSDKGPRGSRVILGSWDSQQAGLYSLKPSGCNFAVLGALENKSAEQFKALLQILETKPTALIKRQPSALP